jgi:hypothetical protein
VNIPKGTIWQQLRSSSLDAIPAEASVAFTAPKTINRWRRDGCYTVTAASGDKITLVATGNEFGAALLSDAEHLLDNAAEHQASLCSATEPNAWLSPAWAVVTIYYWGFYAALALTRLLGKTIWFLDKEAIADFKHLASTPGAKLGAGAYRLDCDAYVSATDRTIALQRDHARLHEAVWRCTTRCLRQARLDARTTNIGEERLYSAIEDAAKKLGEDWPSAIRNTVNYRPGCGYREVLKKGQIDTLRYLKKAERLTIEKIVDALEDELRAIVKTADPAENPAARCRLLLHLTLLLHALTTNLHQELIERRAFDRRWTNLRTNFLQRQGVTAAGVTWPY